MFVFVFFKQKTAYEMRISDWSSDVCSSDLGTLINLAYTALEVGYGLATDSLALLYDALHNFGDVLGLALAWGAAILAQRQPTKEHSFGWRRATLLAPLRSEERRAGKQCVSTCSSRCAPYHTQKNKIKQNQKDTLRKQT